MIALATGLFCAGLILGPILWAVSVKIIDAIADWVGGR